MAMVVAMPQLCRSIHGVWIAHVEPVTVEVAVPLTHHLRRSYLPIELHLLVLRLLGSSTSSVAEQIKVIWWQLGTHWVISGAVAQFSIVVAGIVLPGLQSVRLLAQKPCQMLRVRRSTSSGAARAILGLALSDLVELTHAEFTSIYLLIGGYSLLGTVRYCVLLRQRY